MDWETYGILSGDHTTCLFWETHSAKPLILGALEEDERAL